ncbi:peptidoglycan-recognition protein 2 [Microplitis demolitor]|uniref:peptidoglycan-recognition protein 2 n=1 Tax=Microplitis demolitor TaxID=69319 RepID=UPI0004CCD37B|nr:peptidoglycan-recognition protein 2 [Microplitis demolitor]
MSLLMKNFLVISIFSITFSISNVSGSMVHPPHTMQNRTTISSRQIFESKLVFVNRTEWRASSTVHPPEKLDVIPVSYVMIYHTGTETCFSRETCDPLVRNLQAKYLMSYPLNRDIGYNFVISGDGNVYVGRGWHAVGAHTFGFNRISLGIGLIGTFYDRPLSVKQIQALEDLIKLGVKNYRIVEDFKFYSYPPMAIHFESATEILSFDEFMSSDKK